MTIYDFQIDSDNLGQIPSVRLATEICLHIVGSILRHFSETLVQHCPTDQRILKNHLTTVQWQLGIISRSIPDQPNSDYSFTIHRVHISKKLENRSCINRTFSMETLGHMDPKMLLDCVAQILLCNLEQIKSQLPTSSKRPYDKCVDKITEVIQDLTFLVGDNPEHRNLHGSSRVRLTHLDIIKILVKVHDQDNTTM